MLLNRIDDNTFGDFKLFRTLLCITIGENNIRKVVPWLVQRKLP